MHSQITSCSLTNDDIYTKLYLHAQAGAYTSYLRGRRCTTEDLFFYEISASFQFPWYFGENWAAFDECICDLEWLRFTSIFIVIDDFNLMFNGKKDLQIKLIKYLTNMIEYWKDNGVVVEIWLNN